MTNARGFRAAAPFKPQDVVINEGIWRGRPSGSALH